MGFFKRLARVAATDPAELIERFDDPQALLAEAAEAIKQRIENLDRQLMCLLAEASELAGTLRQHQENSAKWAARHKTALLSEDYAIVDKALQNRDTHERCAAATEDRLNLVRAATSAKTRQVELLRSDLSRARESLTVLQDNPPQDS